MLNRFRFVSVLVAFGFLPVSLALAQPYGDEYQGQSQGPSDFRGRSPAYRRDSGPVGKPRTSAPRNSNRARQASAYQAEGRPPAEQVQLPPANGGGQWQPSGNEPSFDMGVPDYSDGYYPDEGCSSCGPGFGGLGFCRGPIYVRGEYLAWWVKGDNTPPLLTTSTAGTLQPQAGVLGQPNTSTLFGGDKTNLGARSGGRFVVGMWLDPTARIEGEFFALGQRQSGFTSTSNGDPILARPFFDFNPNTHPIPAENSHVVAFPGVVQGTVNAQVTSSFLGAGLHATEMLLCQDYCGDRQWRLDFVYGLRYLHLRETLSANDTLTTIATVAPVGTEFTTADSFTTTNNFFGGTVGLSAEARTCRWCFTAVGRMGIGGTAEQININGNSSTTPPGGTTTNLQGGLLALPSNIGTYNHNGFTVVPELQLKLGYDFTQNLRFTFGYDVLYWSRVARPGEQVDLAVNTSQASGQTLVGPALPRFLLRETDLWVQGISVGGEWRF